MSNYFIILQRHCQEAALRDDLQHSMPMTHPWWRAARAASAKGVKWNVDDEVRRAAWSCAVGDWWATDFGRDMRSVLQECHLDIFSKDKLMRNLERLEKVCPPTARRVLDCAFAEAMADRVNEGLHDRVVKAAVRLCAEDNIDNATAHIRHQHGDYQADAMRTVLKASLSRCETASAPPARTRVRKQKLTTEQGLGIPLNYTPA
jgi:hypothetical protein